MYEGRTRPLGRPLWVVTPAEAGVQGTKRRWIPACAGMTETGVRYILARESNCEICQRISQHLQFRRKACHVLDTGPEFRENGKCAETCREAVFNPILTFTSQRRIDFARVPQGVGTG